jgi:hypothetical protein
MTNTKTEIEVGPTTRRSWRINDLAYEQAVLAVENEIPMDADQALMLNGAALWGEPERRKFKHDFRRHMRNIAEADTRDTRRRGGVRVTQGNANGSTRKLKFNRWGLAEDPIGLHVSWRTDQRTFLATVVGCEYNEFRGFFNLKTRHFNGEDAPDVAAGAVDVLRRDWELIP